MITWDVFAGFAFPAILLWSLGAWMAWRMRRMAALSLTVGGTLLFALFIMGLWLSLERPPLRTMGETRLWYSFFMPIAGLLTYAKWRYKWVLSFSTLMATVFIGVNLLKPEIHSKALMPALQSPWFAPHVIVYMFAYALLGAAALLAVWMLYRNSDQEIGMVDNLVNVGVVFLTIGMLFGAIWAKEAWGHYWSWDPKETWAAATWVFYLLYIHWRYAAPKRIRSVLWLLLFAFLCLQMCWWGIYYLPAVQGTSIHTYNLN